MSDNRNTDIWPNALEWPLIVALGFSYALDLFNYNIVRFLWPAETLYDPTRNGMLFILFLFFGWLIIPKRFFAKIRKAPSLFSIAVLSVLLELGLGLLIILCKEKSPDLIPGDFWYNVAYTIRLIWGMAFSLGLGISLSIISNVFSPRKRTWSTCSIICIALAGPIMASGIAYFGKSMLSGYVAVLFILSAPTVYFYITRKRYPYYNALVLNSIEFTGDIRSAFRSAHLWKNYLWLIISGVSVLFCLNMLLEYPIKFGYSNGVTPDDFNRGSQNDAIIGQYNSIWITGRYCLMLVSSIFFTWRSTVVHSRSLAYRWTVSISAIGVLLYIFGPAIGLTLPLFVVAGLIGAGSGMWTLLMLQAQEIFERKIQPLLLFLLPVFYRVSTGLLRLFLGISDDKPVKVFQPDTVYNIAIIGGVILLSGLIASFFWENNFEGGNNLMAQGYFYNGYEAPILDRETREQLKGIPQVEWKGSDTKAFLQTVVNKIERRMIGVFDTALYAYYLAFSDANGNELYFTEPVVNPDAYRDLRDVSGQDTKNYPEIAKRLIGEHFSSESLTHYSINNGFNGLVITRQSSASLRWQKSKIEAYKANNFKLVNLPDADWPTDHEIREFWLLPDKAQKERFLELFEHYAEQISRIHENKLILKPLFLRILDVARYPNKNYVLYIITPVNIYDHVRRQRAALIIQAAQALPVEKLNELGDMVNWLLLQRTLGLSLEIEWSNLAQDQSHSMKTDFGLLRNKLEQMDASVRNPTEYFQQNYVAAEILIDRIISINTLVLALMRGPNDNTYSETLKIKPVTLRNIIQSTANDLKMTLDHHGFNLTEHRLLVREKCFDQIEHCIKEPVFDLKVNVVESALGIILNDLLSNALKNTQYKKPVVGIYLTERETNWQITISNNESMSQDYYYMIKESRNAEGVSIRQRSGLRMVHRLTRFTRFNQSGSAGQLWQLDVDPESIIPELHLTKIYLFIPKSDVV